MSESAYSRYTRWWLGKKVRLALSDGPFRKVTDVILSGPPSFVYGDVKLVYEDGTSEWVRYPDRKFRPRKKDVEVLEEDGQ